MATCAALPPLRVARPERGVPYPIPLAPPRQAAWAAELQKAALTRTLAAVPMSAGSSRKRSPPLRTDEQAAKRPVALSRSHSAPETDAVRLAVEPKRTAADSEMHFAAATSGGTVRAENFFAGPQVAARASHGAAALPALSP